jgi:DNA-binding transcriptional LysR family regulator
MRSTVQLLTFIEVVNRRSLAAAARALNITPAAVSKQILTLEKELRVQLLTRTTRRLELTPAGITYFEHAKRIIEAFQQAEAALSESTQEPAGLLKVVSGTHFGSLYLVPHLGEFHKRYPKIDLHIEFTQTIPDLEKEKIDAVVGLSVGIPPNWIMRRLYSSRKVLCAAPNYLDKHGTPRKPTDIAKHRIITHTCRKPNNVVTFKNDVNIMVNPILYFNDTDAMRSCALQGVGLVELHDYIVADDLESGALVEVLSNHSKQTKIDVITAYAPTVHLHVKVRRFLDFVIEKCKYGA